MLRSSDLSYVPRNDRLHEKITQNEFKEMIEEGVDNNTRDDTKLMRRIDKIEGMLDKLKTQSPGAYENGPGGGRVTTM